jgi:hypothetical protein
VFGRARRAEEVRAATGREHGVAEADFALRHDEAAVVVADRREREALADRIERNDFARHVAETVAPREDRLRQTFLTRVERARGDLVQRWFPDVIRRTIDEQHFLRSVAAAKRATQPRRQFQPAGAAADDDDVVVHSGLRAPFVSVAAPRAAERRTARWRTS